MNLSQRIEQLEKREGEELKPCGFCAGDNINLVCANGGWLCKCNQCFARTTYYLNKDDAVSAWNTLPAMTEALSIIRELRERMEVARKALGEVSRMRTYPDHKLNTLTLVAAHTLANKALTGTDLTQVKEN